MLLTFLMSFRIAIRCALFANDTIITKERANERASKQMNETLWVLLFMEYFAVVTFTVIMVALQNFRTNRYLLLSIFSTSTTCWQNWSYFLISPQTHKYAIDARLFITRLAYWLQCNYFVFKSCQYLPRFQKYLCSFYLFVRSVWGFQFTTAPLFCVVIRRKPFYDFCFTHLKREQNQSLVCFIEWL